MNVNDSASESLEESEKHAKGNIYCLREYLYHYK